MKARARARAHINIITSYRHHSSSSSHSIFFLLAPTKRKRRCRRKTEKKENNEIMITTRRKQRPLFGWAVRRMRDGRMIIMHQNHNHHNTDYFITSYEYFIISRRDWLMHESVAIGGWWRRDNAGWWGNLVYLSTEYVCIRVECAPASHDASPAGASVCVCSYHTVSRAHSLGNCGKRVPQVKCHCSATLAKSLYV